MLYRRFRQSALVLIIGLVMLGVLLPASVSAAPAQSVTAQAGFGGFYYTVQPGDNLTRLANRFGTSVWAIKNANGLSSSVIRIGQVLFIPGSGGGGGSSCTQTYWVQHGDTLTSIARWFGVSVQSLANANGIWNPSRIYVGQPLCIPGGWGPGPGPQPVPPAPVCGQFYTVRPGDNLTRIARWCGTTVQSLAYINNIWNPSRIYVGQVLRIY